MKIQYSNCAPACTSIGRLKPGTVCTLVTGVSDIESHHPCLVVNLRSYQWQLDNEGCGDKIGLVNLVTNKLSLLNKKRNAIIIEDVEVHIP